MASPLSLPSFSNVLPSFYIKFSCEISFMVLLPFPVANGFSGGSEFPVWKLQAVFLAGWSIFVSLARPLPVFVFVSFLSVVLSFLFFFSLNLGLYLILQQLI